MVTKRDDDRQPTTDDRVNIEQSATGRLEGRVLQYLIVKGWGVFQVLNLKAKWQY